MNYCPNCDCPDCEYQDEYQSMIETCHELCVRAEWNMTPYELAREVYIGVEKALFTPRTIFAKIEEYFNNPKLRAEVESIYEGMVQQEKGLI